MDNTTITSTGNPIVDAVGSLELAGNLIPEYWYYTIANHKCKPNMNAIMILAEIVLALYIIAITMIEILM